MKRIAALLFLSLSVLPFLILKDTWVTTTHIGTTDIFAQDGSFNDANNILGQTGLIENTGSSKFRFELFERIVNDEFAIGKAALLVLRNCNDDKPSTNDLTAKECEILDSEIRRIRLLEPVNEEYEIGASFISGLKSTASRTKKFIEIRVSNEDKDISFVILKSVLIGIDSQLKDVSLVSNYKELEALENALDENISLEQREFLFKEMTKVLIGIENAHFLAKKIIEKKLSVRQTENLIRAIKAYKKNGKPSKNPNLSYLESTIEEKIGIKVFIKNKKNNSGQVTFEYKDLDQLNRLIEVIKVNY